MSHARARRSTRVLALTTFALAALGLALAPVLGLGVASAEDDRPTEVPYDMPGEFPLLNPKYKISDHTVVRIQDYDLSPRQVRIREGELVAWLGFSPIPSVVVFEREVAKKMVCHSLVNFSIKDDELRSAPIHPGEFASFCQLQPGHYRYKVVRNTTPPAGQDAARKLDGEIIVLEKQEE